MIGETIGLVLGSILMFFSYILVRTFMALHIRADYFSKSAYKKYRKEVNFSKRFWFTWLSVNSKAKYSKYERKYINYPFIIKIYKILNIIMLSLLGIVAFFVIMTAIDVFQIRYAYMVMILYSICILFCFIVISIIVGYERTEYHRKRHR